MPEPCDGCIEEDETGILVIADDHTCGAPRPSQAQLAYEQSERDGRCVECGADDIVPHSGACGVWAYTQQQEGSNEE